jgi:putative sigma-54 modulation protein
MANRVRLERTAVELTITAKNLKLTEAIEDYAQKRLSRLDRRLRHPVPLKLELRQEGTRRADQRFVAEITATLKAGILRGEERASSLNAAIDAATDVVERQIRRYKTRHFERGRRETGFEAALAEQFADLEGEEPATELPDGRLVRTKKHVVSPMTVDEAAAQMELLGHSFFVFLNSENGGVNVVYRRRDGDYGLIVPARGEKASQAPA